MRVILLDPSDRVLLMKINAAGVSEPDNTGRPSALWATLGGRLGEGEEVLTAARREVREETGIDDVRVGPILWYGEQVLNVDGEPILFKETFVLAHVETTKTTSAGWTNEEKAAITQMKWWTINELVTTTEAIRPQALASLLRPILAGQYPAPVIDIDLRA